ncbi:MAG: hypothetical protein IIB06_03125, partial [Bacteroidetes bacterium]|nr:hypothetical protein [Bacteroidota bacterium]
MSMHSLRAISPIDGRYASKTNSLISFFSEEALIRYRVQIEIEYFIALVELDLKQLKDFDRSLFSELQKIYTQFSIQDAIKIKEIEKITNHDVKAVEYFIKEKFDAFGLQQYKEFIHFGLTSQDINNTAFPLLLKGAINEVYKPELLKVKDKLKELSILWVDIPMLARTHGQPASPTRLGKELEVFVVRIEEQLDLLNDIKSAAKFGGATGNFNAHKVAYPTIDWRSFAQSFVQEKLGLHYSFPTTQIEHYDHMSALFDCLKRINNILIDLDRDIWIYILMEYFKQKINKGEIGSSAMPHKVNPIDFENAEITVKKQKCSFRAAFKEIKTYADDKLQKGFHWKPLLIDGFAKDEKEPFFLSKRHLRIGARSLRRRLMASMSATHNMRDLRHTYLQNLNRITKIEL